MSNLSPLFNKRNGIYGGSIENRTRLPKEVLGVVCEAAGPDFPVLIKLNSEDFIEGGFAIVDMLYTASMLEEGGIDTIEMTGWDRETEPSAL